jgi:DHA1 family multidrug resistance protein-like MFS transporter
LIAMVYAYWRLPETRHLASAQAHQGERVEPGGPAPEGRAWVRLVTSKDFAAVSFITMAIFLTRTASRQTLMPLLASARFGLSAGGVGAVFTAMSLVNLVLIAPASIVADRAGRKWAIVPAGLVVAIGLLVVGGSGSVALFVLGGIIVSIGTAMSGPAPAAYVADISPPDQRGLGMGLYRSAGDFGFLIGPPLLGALADRTTFGLGLAANAALIAVAALTFAVVARETAGRSVEPATVTEPAPGGGR